MKLEASQSTVGSPNELKMNKSRQIEAEEEWRLKSKKAILEIARLAKERFEDFEETQHPHENESSGKGNFDEISIGVY